MTTLLGFFFGIAHVIFWTVIAIMLVLLVKRRIEIKKNEKFEKRDN